MEEAPLVLLVDDDALTLKSLRLLFLKSGYRVVSVENAMLAQETLQQEGSEGFDCVLTDFRMPQMTGLELVAWLQEQDPTLSAILLTAEGDKDMVTDALRRGACDFLEKPYRFSHVREAVVKAVVRTRERRHAASTVSEVKAITQLHAQLSKSTEHYSRRDTASPLHPRITTCLHPIRETGGDFVNSYITDDGRFFLVLGDVSGHDLKAGFISAYFQGMVRGMLDMKAQVQEICGHFNRHLIEDWNRPVEGNGYPPLKTSLACAIICVDPIAGKLSVHNYGLPPPLYASAATMEKIGKGAPPLGWFSELPELSSERPIPCATGAINGGSCYVWSDGLEDLAREQEVSTLTLAWECSKQADVAKREVLLRARKDDVMVVRLLWEGNEEEAVFYESYLGDAGDGIDEIERYWCNSLARIAPQMSENRLNEVSLCLREAMINAFLHGVKGDASLKVRVKLLLKEPSREIVVIVSDEGLGYCFEETPANPPVEPKKGEHISFGMKIIRSYAQTIEVSDGGRQLKMCFNY